MSAERSNRPRLGDYFSNRQEAGVAGLPTLSVTMNDGLVPRDELDRKMETTLSAEEHLLVRSGDVAYNMMRMWQGACGLATHDAIVSPAYVVLKPKAGIDTRFAYHWFKSARMLYLLWAYSHGITDDRLRLYFDDFAEIPIAPPPIDQQSRVAAVLDGWDDAIATTARLIERKQALRGALTSRLIGGPGVAFSKVAEIAFSGVDKKIHTSERQVRLCNYMDVLNNRRLTNGLAFSAGSASHQEVERFALLEDDVIFTKDSETAEDIAEVSVVAEPLDNVICGYHLAVARPRSGRASGRYLAHAIRAPKVRAQFMRGANGVVRFGLTLKEVADIEIPLPPLAVQVVIAQALDTADDRVSSLQELLALLRLQKRGLMQKLLTGQWRVPESIDALLPSGARVAEAAE